MGGTYNTRNWRAQGGSTWHISGDVVLESSGHEVTQSGFVKYSSAATAHTTALSVLSYGVLNTCSNADSTGIVMVLPTTPLPGAQVWVVPLKATTGQFYVSAVADTGTLGKSIGTSTESGAGQADNNMVSCTGPLGFMAISSSEWMLISGVAAVATTVVGTSA